MHNTKCDQSHHRVRGKDGEEVHVDEAVLGAGGSLRREQQLRVLIPGRAGLAFEAAAEVQPERGPERVGDASSREFLYFFGDSFNAQAGLAAERASGLAPASLRRLRAQGRRPRATLLFAGHQRCGYPVGSRATFSDESGRDDGLR